MASIAAKHTDLIVGMDMHMIQPPPPAAPVMVPHPVVGMIFDPADYSPGVATVYVNDLPRARAGTMCLMSPPHVPIGGMFVKPPLSEAEVHQGSSTVTCDGDAMSGGNHEVLGCHDVGAPAPVRAWKSGGAKSLMKPGSVVVAIPGGAIVMVGGTPTTSASPGRAESGEREFIAFEIVDEDGVAYEGVHVVTKLADGTTREAVAPEDGVVEYASVPVGTCETRLFTCRPRNPLPSRHVVVQGEWARSIAALYGLSDWKPMWEHAENHALREARRPEVLAPGDVVFVPEPDPLTVETGMTHRLTLNRPSRVYTVRLLGEARDLPTALEYALSSQLGECAERELLLADLSPARDIGEGRFELDVSHDAKTIMLRSSDCTWFTQIARLDPIPPDACDAHHPTVVQRLVALSLLSSNEWARSSNRDAAREALMVFQSTTMGRADADGTLDADTRRALAALTDEADA